MNRRLTPERIREATEDVLSRLDSPRHRRWTFARALDVAKARVLPYFPSRLSCARRGKTAGSDSQCYAEKIARDPESAAGAAEKVAEHHVRITHKEGVRRTPRFAKYLALATEA